LQKYKTQKKVIMDTVTTLFIVIMILAVVCLMLVMDRIFNSGFARHNVGTIFMIDNKDRKFGADPSYFGAALSHEGDTEIVWHLFTSAQMRDAAERARKNPEDLLF